jgi:hypothetical protein
MTADIGRERYLALQRLGTVAVRWCSRVARSRYGTVFMGPLFILVAFAGIGVVVPAAFSRSDDT